MLAGLVLLAAPSLARGATTFGADLTQQPTNDCNACAVLTLTKTGGAAETGSPITGILVSARVKTRNFAATGNFRILHPTGNPEEYRNDGEAPVSVTMDGTLEGHETQVFTRLPIQAGDRLGISFPGQDVYFLSAPNATAQCAFRFEGTTQPIGTAATYTTPDCTTAGMSYEILVAGTVEADADGDGYGDETQDGCPTNATLQTACPPGNPASPINPAGHLRKRKCKKKPKSAAAAKRRKCRKKRR